MTSSRGAICAVLAAASLSGCITTSMQGYADRQLPARPVGHIIAYVAGPNPPLVSSIQRSIAEEAHKRGIAADDALSLFRPTRIYSNAEVQQGLTGNGIDGVLIINVGDTGVQQQYADSDDLARVYRFDLAQDSEMISPTIPI